MPHTIQCITCVICCQAQAITCNYGRYRPEQRDIDSLDEHTCAPCHAPSHRAIVAVDPRLVLRPPLSGEAYLRDALAPSWFAMALLTAFALLALALSAVGLYGVIAYSVSQRTREIGVRIALGAQPVDLARLVVGDRLRLAIAGIIVGVGGAVARPRRCAACSMA